MSSKFEYTPRKRQIFSRYHSHIKRRRLGEITNRKEVTESNLVQRQHQILFDDYKNPLVILNELKLHPVFTFTGRSGPEHLPKFTYTSMINGNVFYGKGLRKRDARVNVADSIVKFIRKNENLLSEWIQMYKTVNGNASKNNYSENITNSKNITDEEKTKSKRVTKIPDKENAVSLLYRNYVNMGIKTDCVATESGKFKFTFCVAKQKFDGIGSSKRLAKMAAAKNSLAQLMDMPFSELHNLETDSKIRAFFHYPQTFANCIGEKIVIKFDEIMQENPIYQSKKVMAGFVMSHKDDPKSLKVISLATGTKCINGEHISIQGTAINDCHAEILARRGLVKYFYDQLELHSIGQSDESIFLRKTESKLYQLREDLNFHLYINTAPCGDARVFSPKEEMCDGDPDIQPSKAHGRLRVKIESGEGTIPTSNVDILQTWDGVIHGQRLMTMSCSDKVAKWNVLGVQGALLANLIEPVYVKSIVLGSLLHPTHMYRATFGRIENVIDDLPLGYKLNKPKMGLVTSSETRSTSKAPNHSVNWVNGFNDVEIINSISGKYVEGGGTSRLSKRELFKRYKEVIKKLPGIDNRSVLSTYQETKASSVTYQSVKELFCDAFNSLNLGRWVKKPCEQDQFTILS